MSKTALVLIADGSEEMEAVITIDVLRRAGINVVVAGLNGTNPVKCSRGVVIIPDKSFIEVANESYDVVILPGGLDGANAFANSSSVKSLLVSQEKADRLIAIICAAPIALVAHGIGLRKTITSHPSKKEELCKGGQYIYSEERVVVDGNLITSRGPGTAFEFAFAITEKLVGADKVREISAPMILK